MKIGLVGDRQYTNRRKIKDFIFKLKQKGGIEVVGCGGEWKDHFMDIRVYPSNFVGDCVKNFTLEFELKYTEFPPSHSPYNMYCALEPYNYGKPFKVWNYKVRDKKIVQYSDRLVIFKSSNDASDLIHFVRESKKLNKPFIVIEK